MRGMHQLDDRVFVKDAKFAWLPATVVQCTHDEVLVNLALPSDWRATTKGSKREMPKERWVKLDDYKDRALPFQNTGKASRDMADLPHLHEAAILYQIKERHTMQRPYTRVGEIVVAVNPCSWIKDLYSADQGVLYAKNFVWHMEDAPETPGDLREEKKEESPIGSTSFGSIYNKLGVEPHVYEVSALAYRGMFLERKNQTILVSGESGAGKTETVKIILNHLATLETSSLSVGDVSGNDMIQHIVESSPVFEAFGNAQTVRNHNSSRFGKMTRLHFGFRSNGMCGLRGSTCRTYLLETNRVVSQAPGERNFHIFYQLLAASPEAKVELLGNSWEHTDAKDFLYLNGTKTAAKDAEMWEQTRSALEFFDWKGDKLHGLCQALAVVLRLGNIIFDQDPESDGCHTSYAQVELAAEALGLSANTLDHALRHRVLQMGGDRVDVKLTPSNAKNALDTLVRKIYEIVFQSILRSVNEKTKEKNFEETDGIISLLDIYGFEAFEVNRFEQLCINYANEMLHKKYIDDNFKRVKDEYEEEGIELFDFSTVDNADVLELLQGRQGIISMVNEECVIPNGSSLNFVQKLKQVHKGHDRLLAGDLLHKSHFGINHFAAPVMYEASEFVERNVHRLPSELLGAISKSSNSIIAGFFKSVIVQAGDQTTGVKRQVKRSPKKAVLEKFRLDLHDLMKSMEDTETRYIRCVKPNETLSPAKFDHGTVMRQLRCAGLVTAIDLSRETYPNKLPLSVVEDRFGCLMSPVDAVILHEMPVYDRVQYIMSRLYAPLLEVYRNCEFTMPYACGKTKAFFRSGALEMLESLRFQFFSAWTLVIQTDTRRWLAQRKVLRLRNGVKSLQAQARGFSSRKMFRRTRGAVIAIQSFYRSQKERKRMEVKRRAIVVLQSRWRIVRDTNLKLSMLAATSILTAALQMRVERAKFLRKRHLCTQLQGVVRGRSQREKYRAILEAISSIQATTRRTLLQERAKEQRKAARVIRTFLGNAVKSLRIKRAVGRIQVFGRRIIAVETVRQQRRTIVVIRSFLRTAIQRMRFINIYMATLTLQSFFRMRIERIRYQMRLQSYQHRSDASDSSEIYTTATPVSRDGPASGILRKWMNEGLEEQKSVLSTKDDTGKPGKTYGCNSFSFSVSAQSGPSVKAGPETSSSSATVSDHEDEPTFTALHEMTVDSTKDQIIAKLKQEIDEMRYQETQMREDIAAVVEEAKGHEQMVEEEFEDRIVAYEEEVVQLKEIIKESQAEKDALYGKVELLRHADHVPDHREKLIAMEQQAKSIQASHVEYISNISRVLDAANEARRRETDRILGEFDSLKLEKDQEMKDLRAQIRLTSNAGIKSTQGGAPVSADSDQASEVSELRDAILAAVSPARVAQIVGRADRKPWSKEAYVDEKLSLRVGQYVERLCEIAVSSLPS